MRPPALRRRLRAGRHDHADANEAIDLVTIVVVILILWVIIGLVGFVVDRMMTPDMLARMSAYDQRMYAARPGWTIWAYGLATLCGLMGGIALLLRRAVARPIFVVSLVFVLLLFGWSLGATDLIAEKGFVAAAGFPIVIAAIGVFEIWLSGIAVRRGWIA